MLVTESGNYRGVSPVAYPGKITEKQRGFRPRRVTRGICMRLDSTNNTLSIFYLYTEGKRFRQLQSSLAGNDSTQSTATNGSSNPLTSRRDMNLLWNDNGVCSEELDPRTCPIPFVQYLRDGTRGCATAIQKGPSCHRRPR